MEIERDRPLKDLSEDLGHSSSATTDTVYVQVERKRRALSGKIEKPSGNNDSYLLCGKSGLFLRKPSFRRTAL